MTMSTTATTVYIRHGSESYINAFGSNDEPGKVVVFVGEGEYLVAGILLSPAEATELAIALVRIAGDAEKVGVDR